MLCETHFLTWLDCNGITVSFAGDAGGAGPDTVEFSVRASQKSYHLWDWNRLKSSHRENWTGELTNLQYPRQNGYMRVLDTFLGMLKGDAHTMPPLRAALTVQEIVESILPR